MYKSLSSTTSTTKLKHQPSKLDLIDDTTLTSLPLPPPPPLRRHLSRSQSQSRSRSRSLTSSSQGSKLSQSNSINNSMRINSNNSNNNCQLKNLDANYSYEEIGVDDIDDICYNDEEVGNYNKDKDYDYDYDYDCEYEYEYTFDEDSQDPIVLIEDYFQPQNIKFSNNNRTTTTNTTITTNNNTLLDQQKLLRQQSLANFKQSLLLIHNYHNPLNSTNHTNTTYNNESDLILKINRKEDLQAIFGEIPGSKLLKYCEFCEKPLYEISSIINNNNNNNNNNQSLQQQYHYEFICGDCIETYDHYYNLEFANIAIGSDCGYGYGYGYGKDGDKDKDNRNKLWKIFHSISYKYKIIE